MKKPFCHLAIFAIVISSVSATQAQDADAQKVDGKWGHLKGHIVVSGKLPEIPLEDITKDKPVCLKDGQPPKDDNLIVSDKNEIRDVFVFMYFKKNAPQPAIHPKYKADLKKEIVLDNKDCRFAPHALLVRPGQTLKLLNSDDAGHNCHINGFGNEHNINLPANESVDLVLANPEKTPIKVNCDIHPWMDAYMLVREEPYFAITGEDGRFLIDSIPAGTWTFQFWHKRGAYLRKLDIPGYKVGRRGEITVTIKDGETLDLGDMTLPGSSLTK